MCPWRHSVRLDPDLLRAAKRHAADAGVTLTALIEDGLRAILARRDESRRTSRRGRPTYRGDGVRPGVDLDNSEALRDAMDA